MSFLALASSGSPPHGATTPRSELSVRFIDPHDLLPSGSDQIASELARVFAELGVRVRWLPGAEPAASGSVRVVLTPSEPSGRGWTLPSSALGVTVGDGVTPAPAVYVFYPRVLRALGIAPRVHRLPSTLELRRLTRALARVAAHELFHALAPGQEHADAGLMSASLTPELLVGERVEVDPRWAGLLLRGLEEVGEASVLE